MGECPNPVRSRSLVEAQSQPRNSPEPSRYRPLSMNSSPQKPIRCKRGKRKLGKTILRDLGKLLFIPALMSLSSLLICLIFREWGRWFLFC